MPYRQGQGLLGVRSGAWAYPAVENRDGRVQVQAWRITAAALPPVYCDAREPRITSQAPKPPIPSQPPNQSAASSIRPFIRRPHLAHSLFCHQFDPTSPPYDVVQMTAASNRDLLLVWAVSWLAVGAAGLSTSYPGIRLCVMLHSAVWCGCILWFCSGSTK